MTFFDDLEYIRRRSGRSIVLPTPPACLALVKAAKAAGIPIGTLFILSRALSPAIRGSYDRKTGDLWCHFDGSEKDGAREVLQCLLTLIAHVKLQHPPPVTIEQDWDQARSAHREAFALAQAWGREDLFTQEDLTQFLADDTYHYRMHSAAGMLAGNLDPSLARSAYLALLDVQARYQWSNAQFEAALSGEMEDEEEENTAVLDFDRCQLRAFWLSTSMCRGDQEPDLFGEYALPSTFEAVSTLRSALEQAARHRTENGLLQSSLYAADGSARVFLRVTSTQDLSMVIEHVNTWLLEALPQCYARVQWDCMRIGKGEKSLSQQFTFTTCVLNMIPAWKGIKQKQAVTPPAENSGCCSPCAICLGPLRLRGSVTFAHGWHVRPRIRNLFIMDCSHCGPGSNRNHSTRFFRNLDQSIVFFLPYSTLFLDKLERRMKHVPRRVIQGMHVLLYQDGPYVEVAERIRILHKLNKDFRIHRAETLFMRNWWIYRVTISIDAHQYIGDAEMYFGAPKETPDGTNPVTCGQTSAIGNALTFAGFGDPRLLLEKQDLRTEEVRDAYPADLPYGEVEGIRVVWIDETPYVPVAERLYYLHALGRTFSMEHCEVIRVNGVWVYRVSIIVDGQQYIGDAEIHFAAPLTAPHQRFPVSTAQTSAVGNALALAGFGDVRALFERRGMEVKSAPGMPSLASADAILNAVRERRVLAEGREGNGHEKETEQTVPVREGITAPMTTQQRAEIRDLCAQLGMSEPQDMDGWTVPEAEGYLEELHVQINELLETADMALVSDTDNGSTPDSASRELENDIATHKQIGDLKRAWMLAFNVEGTSASIKQQWETFKRERCQAAVNDEAMSRAQYAAIKDAIEQQLYKKASQQPVINGRAAKR
jgi:hypothetical protein